jgi:tetratricopeptide (TPR) repeat protein
LWNRRTEDDLRKSLRYFQEAINSDPTYAPAYAGIADSYLTLMDQGYLSTHEATAKARRAVMTALQLDDRLAEAHISLAHAAFHEFDWPTAEREFRRGIELNPSYSIARHYYSNYLLAMGRAQDAITEAAHARQLDPVSAAQQSNMASILWHARQYERSLEEGKKTVAMNPDYSGAYEDLGRVYEQVGDFDAAIEAFQKAASLAGESLGSLASLGHTYAVAGRRSEAEAIMEKLRDASRTTFVSAYPFALLCVGLGRKDEAFAWFGKAYDERSSALPFLNVNPRLDSLHGDPRFEKLLTRMHLPH